MRRAEAYPGFLPPRFTQVPNDAFDLLPEMSGAEVKVLLIALRQTFGYHQPAAPLSVRFLAEKTGLSVNSVRAALAELCRCGLLELVSPGAAATSEAAVYAVRTRSDNPSVQAVIERARTRAKGASSKE